MNDRMKTDSAKRGGLRAPAATVVLAILAASLLIVVLASGSHPAINPTKTVQQKSSTQGNASSASSAFASTSTVQSGGSTTRITTTQDISCPTTCTLDVDWASLTHPYQTLGELAASSEFVFVGNVTATWTLPSSGVPVNLYNITVVTTLKGHPYTPNPIFQLGEVGGTLSNKTTTVSGYPTLTVGGMYILFVYPAGGVCCTNGTEVLPNAPFSFQVDEAFPGTLVYVTQGGPQGLFYVQGGYVYSLDNMYPQADAWLPVKVPGVPLAQFIQEIQSAAAK